MSLERPENSTNGRIVIPVPWPVRVASRALGLVSPTRAQDWALRLFETPPRPRAPKAGGAGRAAAEAALWREAEPLSVLVRGARVRAWRWGAGPAALLVHGWGGRGRQLRGFVAPLVSAGRSVVTFDAPAHGESEGRSATLPLLAEAIAAVVAAADRPVVTAVAHSLGAAAVAMAIERGLDLRRAVFLSPMVDVSARFDAFMHVVGLPGGDLSRLRARAERRYDIRWSDLDSLARASRMAAELLIIHDRDDRRVPAAEAAALAAAWPGARLVASVGRSHNGVLSDPALISQAVAFLAPPPAAPLG